MRQLITAGILVISGLSFSAVAQDWYHDRDARYRGDQWHSTVFADVRSDLDHIRSARRASDKERRRLERTREELTDLQEKLDHGVFDNGHVNDVIDSLNKSAGDDRLSRRDRDVLADDLSRIKDYQHNHNHWRH